MARLSFRILGCGSSGGVPRLGPDWGDCDPSEVKNRRRRCSLLITRQTDAGVTRVLIDTGPDLREQLIDAQVTELDGVVYTHSHADHVHGIDDLRQIVNTTRKRLDVWADGPTEEALLSRFAYAFVQPEGSPYPPICALNTIDGPVTITGAGGAITLTPIPVDHGTMDAIGFRIGDLVYIPDVIAIPDASWALLQGLDCFIIDALRRKPHPTHAHLALALEWIERLKPRHAVLTNMHNDLDYQTLYTELPAHIRPAFDGMTIEVDDASAA
ncbi:MAG: MBL fold metallo-hydrolase [Deltaproteobacteria bacterium]